MMDAKTWLTAEQCVELGLADRLADTDADMSGASTILQKMNAGMEQHLRYQKSLAAQLRDWQRHPGCLRPTRNPRAAEALKKSTKFSDCFLENRKEKKNEQQ